MTEIYSKSEFNRHLTTKAVDRVGIINAEVLENTSTPLQKHAPTFGAYGTLVITKDMSAFTRANSFHSGVETPLVVKFSSLESLDFTGVPLKYRISTKLYTSQGNLDLVAEDSMNVLNSYGERGLNQIFYEQNFASIPIYRRSIYWERLLDHPELLPLSFYQLHKSLSNFPLQTHFLVSHTFILTNSLNQKTLARFRLDSCQVVNNFYLNQEGQAIEPDKLFKISLQKKIHPRWKLKVQLISEKKFGELEFNPLDEKCHWPTKAFPIEEIGYLEFNHSPENYEAEIDGLDFNVSHSVQGISCNLQELENIFDNTIYNDECNAIENCQYHYIEGISAIEKKKLHELIAECLGECTDEVCEGVLALFNTIHPDLETEVRRALVKL